jgi:RNA polymerase sigma-70 factor (ECF subfamily)
LYLLFNEGYHGASAEAAVRADLCSEALRLVRLLLEAPGADLPETRALAALMHLHAARLPGRLDGEGDLNPLLEQDRTRWDASLVADGLALLDHAAEGATVTAYHVEAAIAAVHSSAASLERTDWGAIVRLYDGLMTIAPSPVVALNRAIAIGQRDGAERGLDALNGIADADRLERYPFYPAARAEFERGRGDLAAACRDFAAAASLARNPAERRFLEKRARDCATSADLPIRVGAQRR